ncbi:MAG: cation:proton antiporter [Candidatus Thermoplasmatota archaeon]|jgi:Kef-type K+ transport system membrane component KefB|nr:cation:proton antiporter [Candidatus Thermoplasmatota archaeon]MCL5984851.1 cation:proton antiporter [Candidatus Thermoplasmatota archaeon]
MDPTTQFIVDLFLLLGGAVLAGEAATHFKQPAMVGQLLVGILLGPTLLGPFLGLNPASPQSPALTPQLSAMQILATVFILFMAGLDVSPEDFYQMELSTAILGVAVFFVPFGVATLVIPFVLHGISLLESLLIAVTISITALPVMGVMLQEFGLSKSRVGKLLINTALVNEFSAIAVFSIILKIGSGSTSGVVAMAIALLSVALFISIMLTIHTLLGVLRSAKLWEPLKRQFARAWHSKQGGFALLLVLMVGSTLFSQYLGLTYVVGAFYAGLLVTRESAGHIAHTSISGVMEAMSWGFFIPVFFALVGAEMNLRLLDSVYWLTAFGVLLAVAIGAKYVTGFSIASLSGWRGSDTVAIGYMVGSRGAVELAMASILLASGTVDIQIFTLIAGIGVVTTILAPIGALRAWRADPVRMQQMRDGKDASAQKAQWMRPPQPPLNEVVIPDHTLPPRPPLPSGPRP